MMYMYKELPTITTDFVIDLNSKNTGGHLISNILNIGEFVIVSLTNYFKCELKDDISHIM